MLTLIKSVLYSYTVPWKLFVLEEIHVIEDILR